MEESANEKVAGVSFAILFGPHQDAVSYERVEEFLNQAVRYAAEQAEVSPNQLVRVVHGNQVTWMTQKQAAEFLQRHDTDAVRQDIERALKGELKFIRQELEILLALAFYTLNQFKKKNLISTEEIAKLEPSLKRRQAEINEGITQTAESEAILKEKRRRSPILDQYEQMMGEFLNAQKEGLGEQVNVLAKELGAKKRQYLLQARAVEPDVYTIYFHRLNLQKTKKRILGTQTELCSTRKDTLQFEVNELQDNLLSVREQSMMAETEGLDSAASEIKRMRVYDLETKEQELAEKKSELCALEQETQVLELRQQEVQSVIEHISVNVFQEAELKVDMQEITRSVHKPITPSTPQGMPAGDKGNVMYRKL